MITLKIELGALAEAPCYEGHKRGRNWCAKIWRDPKGPSGLGREFWTPAKGDFYYLVPKDVVAGIPLEFGADYHTYGGRITRKRMFFVLTKVMPNELTLEEYETAARAIKAAKSFVPPEPQEVTMGVIHHNAVVATCYGEDRLKQMKAWIDELKIEHTIHSLDPKKLFVFGGGIANDYHTIVLVPDGSKEGWPDSAVGDNLRDLFIAKLKEEGSWSWIEVGFGECGQKILQGNNWNCYA